MPTPARSLPIRKPGWNAQSLASISVRSRKASFVKKQVRYALTAASTADELLAELENELNLLSTTPADQLDTTLLIHPRAMTDFLDYHFFVAEAVALIRNLGFRWGLPDRQPASAIRIRR
jgi:hypothetical protein